MRRLAVIICSLLLALAAHAQDASVLLPFVTAQPWTPINLGAKLAVWFDADDNSKLLDAAGNPADDAEAVATWLDKSGNNYHATGLNHSTGNLDANIRPTRRANIQNGRSVVRTDGDDALTFTPTTVFKNKTHGYIFLVGKDAAPASGDVNRYFVLFAQAVDRSTRFGVEVLKTDKKWKAVTRRLNAHVLTLASSASETTNTHTLVVAAALWGSGKIGISIDSGTFQYADLPSSGACDNTDEKKSVLFFNAPNYRLSSGSEIAEIIAVNDAMTDVEIAATQNYLKTKWGTP